MKFASILLIAGASAISLREKIDLSEPEACPTAQQVIDHYDANKNGKMSGDEAIKLAKDILDHIGLKEPSQNLKEWGERMFKKIAGEDGEIDADEMQEVLEEMLPGGENWCHGPKVKEVMQFFDKNGDKFISWKEFGEGMGQVAAHMGFEPGEAEKKWARRTFKKVAGKDGKIDRKELKEVLDYLYGRD